ncbi:MAG: hypothetical protein NWE98_11060 [Candidatus Bathyarchaeota archaeon]|nr:hypothetical protein [Candidatus Bathyarchaeota archaeon]
MDSKNILQQIIDSAKPFNECVSFSTKPGIYGVFFYGDKFPLVSAEKHIKSGSLIYIGKTESSQIDRDIGQHFASGETGRSTLRRSLGALLRVLLGLKPEPRNPTESSDRKYRNYRFDIEGEKSLTQWMKTNLGLSFYEYDESPREIERLETELIHLSAPILNLKSNSVNPWKSEVSNSRSKCAQLARKASDFSGNQIPDKKQNHSTRKVRVMSDQLTLHEAMKEVLQGCTNKTATFTFVSSEISKRGLYAQKEGGDAPPSQIRLRARKYPHLFEIIPPDKVKLK